jgi:uncharacterized protein (TIGR00251 family)
MARISLKVVPGAATSGIAGWLGATLKVRVAAPPEKGRANDAVEALMAEALGVPIRAVRIVSGHGSPRKTLEVEGLSDEALRRRLDAAGSG